MYVIHTTSQQRTFRDRFLRGIITLEDEQGVVLHPGLVVPPHRRRLYDEAGASLLRLANAVRLNEVVLGEAVGITDGQRPVLDRPVDWAPETVL